VTLTAASAQMTGGLLAYRRARGRSPAAPLRGLPEHQV